MRPIGFPDHMGVPLSSGMWVWRKIKEKTSPQLDENFRNIWVGGSGRANEYKDD